MIDVSGVRSSWLIVARKLDSEHDLAKKLGLRSEDFLAKAAASLGYPGRARELAQSHVGGRKEGA